MTSGHEDHELYASQGIGSAIGFGERPAVLVIDYQRAFTSGSLAADYPEAELRATAEVLRAARAAGVPVAYTVCAYEPDLSDAGPFGVKCPGLVACTRGTRGLRGRRARRAGGRGAGAGEDAAVGLLRHRPGRAPARAGRRHRRRLRHHDVGLRAGDGRRRHEPRLPRGRADRGGGRPLAGRPRPGAVRHGPQVRRRRPARRRRRAAGARPAAARRHRPWTGRPTTTPPRLRPRRPWRDRHRRPCRPSATRP